MREKVRVGIIGSGFVALTHAEALKYDDRAKVVAIAGGSRAPALARDYDVTCESSIESLIARKDINAVVICTPHALHAREALTAFKMGKHVLVEKPMATTAKDCQAMIELSKEKGLKLMVAHFQRYRKPNVAAKDVFKAGALGKVRMITQRLTEVAQNKPWQIKPESKGFLLGYGVHGIDLLRWWLSSEVESIFALCGRYRGYPVEDGTLSLMKFENGVFAFYLCSEALPIRKGPISPGAAGFTTTVIGEKGILEVNSYGKTILDDGNSRKTLAELPTWDNVKSPKRIKAYAAQDKDFITSIINDSEPPIPGSEGMANVVVALAAYESNKQNRVIALKDFSE